MRICYVLPRLELSGGLKVAFQQAEILRQRGYDVTVLGRGGHPDWSPYLGVYIDIARSRADLPRQDLVIATFWTTVEVAEALDIGPVVHYCQGYEADYDHLANQRGQIEAAYERAPSGLRGEPASCRVAQRELCKANLSDTAVCRESIQTDVTSWTSA